MSKDTTNELSKEAAAAARMAGDGLCCTGYLGCRCHECRAEERHLAEWAERANATVYAEERAAARLEVSE